MKSHSAVQDEFIRHQTPMLIRHTCHSAYMSFGIHVIRHTSFGYSIHSVHIRQTGPSGGKGSFGRKYTYLVRYKLVRRRLWFGSTIWFGSTRSVMKNEGGTASIYRRAQDRTKAFDIPDRVKTEWNYPYRTSLQPNETCANSNPNEATSTSRNQKQGARRRFTQISTER